MINSSSIITLRNCPFCRGEAILHHSRDGEASFIKCNNCQASGGSGLVVTEVIAHWNTRHEDETVVARLLAEAEMLLDTPEIGNFIKAIQIEMPHQIARWGKSHDANKTTSDWIRLAVHLLGKASTADWNGDQEKLKHHIITTAAVLGNFHTAIIKNKAV